METRDIIFLVLVYLTCVCVTIDHLIIANYQNKFLTKKNLLKILFAPITVAVLIYRDFKCLE
jgi:hypothetical protein